MSGGYRGARRALVAGEVALSVVLLWGAVLLLETLWRMQHDHLGFVPEHVISVSIPLRDGKMEVAQRKALTRGNAGEIQRLPGTMAASWGECTPLTGGSTRAPCSAQRPAAAEAVGSRRYGGWVRRGSGVLPGLGYDGCCAGGRSRRPTTIIRKRWRSSMRALARRIFRARTRSDIRSTGAENGGWKTVVGVVTDSKNQGLNQPPTPQMFVNDVALYPGSRDGLRGAARGQRAAVRRTRCARSCGRWTRACSAKFETLDEAIGRMSAGSRFNGVLVGSFAAVAFLMAVIGVYGVLAFAVAQRTQEIGIRMALGAGPRACRRLVLREGVVLVAIGTVSGIGGSLLAGRYLKTLLYDITATDVWTYTAVVAAIGIAAMVAALDSGAAGVAGGRRDRSARGVVSPPVRSAPGYVSISICYKTCGSHSGCCGAVRASPFWRFSASPWESAQPPRYSVGSKASCSGPSRRWPTRSGWWPWLRMNRGTRSGVSWPDFDDLRRNCKFADAFIADRIFGTTLAIGDRAERATGSIVSANYFDALGIKPILGRGFEPAEETGRNAHPVTVIAYQTWQDRYHGDPNIIGRTQMLAGVKHTIVGVAPQGFYGTFVGYAFQFWVPASMQETFEPGGYKMENRGARWIEGFVRLKPGVTLEQAQAEISAVAGRLADPISGDQSRTRHPLVSAVANAVQRRQYTVAHAAGIAGSGGLRAADRVRQRRQSAAGAQLRAAAGDDHPAGGGRGALATAKTAAHRRTGTLGAGGIRRTDCGVLVPESDYAADPGSPRRQSSICRRKSTGASSRSAPWYAWFPR